MAKPKYIFLNLPEFSEFEKLGFGLNISYQYKVPDYLAPWLSTGKDGVRFSSAQIPLLDENFRTRLAPIASENHDYVSLLGTRNNVSRILLACAAPNLLVVASTARNWVRVAINADEWFELAAPKLLTLEENLKQYKDEGVSDACLVAAARYFGIERLS